ncbi:MAG: hypothetical protein A2287_02890 [Candidatus Melainabacteria bacterium RIFOXYA12_FULL_32_12]|nr:MAG: hypothetical protein A2104_08405 [Candidatus Melainabacteria bacterium GWF2_32_7]OGI22727.1 MAG: hypothetical protein A2255_08335 [Candidatus Melainabacteria bacterium RIFOXYA2_FULL_32_9]OGI29330.1 MAG: hypothetical protein A2287_02890 [Candidatus Melainabacteria bacterium RIFOXYA12_FULL_32_12]
MADPKISTIIDHLWKWITTYKDRELIRDTSNLYSTKFDGFINSTLSDPLSFSVFELSDKGELIIDDMAKLVESQAAFFLFVNTKTGWIVAVKNRPENVKKLARKEAIQSLKVRIIP